MSPSHSAQRRALGVVLTLALAACNDDITPPTTDAMTPVTADADAKKVTYWLTLLHNNDGEYAVESTPAWGERRLRRSSAVQERLLDELRHEDDDGAPI